MYFIRKVNKLRIRIIVLAMLLILINFFGYRNISDEKRLAALTWEKVANKEFSNWDYWAGTGLYFYEAEGEKYCVYMIYGSGVPVAYHYESKAVITKGNIIISLPTNMEVSDLNEDNSNNKVKEINLIIEDDLVKMGETKFVRSEGLNSYNKIIK